MFYGECGYYLCGWLQSYDIHEIIVGMDASRRAELIVTGANVLTSLTLASVASNDYVYVYAYVWGRVCYVLHMQTCYK